MAIDWTKTQKKYKGLWVALADDELTVLGSGKTLRDALQKARDAGNHDPILTRMPENVEAYVGAI